MKQIIFGLILSLSIIPTLAFSEGRLVTFTIEREIYEGMDSNQQKAIEAKVAELNEFFEESVYPHIPSSIYSRINSMRVKINFNDKTGRDGLFVPGENEHEHKIFVQLIQLNSNGFKALLAHEFYHAIHFELNPNEEPWVREGMAQIFEYIVTDELNGTNIQAATLNPFTPLIGSYDPEKNNAAQYGHDLLYFYYLYNHCGGDQLFWSITEGSKNLKGSSLIDNVLIEQNLKNIECSNFSSSALFFEVSKFHNQTQLTKPDEMQKFFLAPTNITPKNINFETAEELTKAITSLPPLSSLKVNLETWNKLKGQCKNCMKFYARRSFPYDVSSEIPTNNSKSYDVILVKTKAL